MALSARGGSFVGPSFRFVLEPFRRMMRRERCDLIATVALETGFAASILRNSLMLGAGSQRGSLATDQPKGHEHSEHGYHQADEVKVLFIHSDKNS